MLFAAGVLLLILPLALWYAAYHVLPYAAIRPYRISQADIIRKTGSSDPLAAAGIAHQEFRFLTKDSLTLDAWWVPVENACGTVIVMHGISSSKELSYGVIIDYHRRGYNVVAYDERAHGKSEGLNATIGYYEKYDVSACIDAIENRSSFTRPLLIHGFSMGGAISLQAMAIEKRIQGGIVEGAFCNLRETMLDYMEKKIYIRWGWMASIAFARAEELAQFQIDEVRPERSAESIQVPVLIIHGVDDERISVRYAERNFQHLACRDKQLITIPGATHMTIEEVGGQTVRNAIDAFLLRVQANQNTSLQ